MHSSPFYCPCVYAGEKYHQYDNFVYPKALKSRRGLWTSIKRFFGGLSDEKSKNYSVLYMSIYWLYMYSSGQKKVNESNGTCNGTTAQVRVLHSYSNR